MSTNCCLYSVAVNEINYFSFINLKKKINFANCACGIRGLNTSGCAIIVLIFVGLVLSLHNTLTAIVGHFPVTTHSMFHEHLVVKQEKQHFLLLFG